jgi:hypothetical protein
MLAVDLGDVVAGIVLVQHGVPHVSDGLSVALVLDVVDQFERDILHVNEGEEDEAVRKSV